MKEIANKILHGPLAPMASILFRCISNIEYWYFERKWKKQGFSMPDQEEVEFVRENVTVIFKSFERQKMAKRLYENLQKYYPGVRVVIADDSRKPLDLQGDSLTIIQLPFNSGLSYGLNQALERVDTPYVMRVLDGDLTSNIKYSLEKTVNTQAAGEYPIEFRVMDSGGNTVYLKTQISISDKSYAGIDVKLKDYLIYLSVGDAFDPNAYFDSADKEGELTVQSNVNTAKAGS